MTIALMLCLLSVPYAECSPDTAYQIISVETTMDRGYCLTNTPYFETDPALKRHVGRGRYVRIMCGPLPPRLS